jgi:hypothetical protein
MVASREVHRAASARPPIRPKSLMPNEKQAREPVVESSSTDSVLGADYCAMKCSALRTPIDPRKRARPLSASDLLHGSRVIIEP